MMNPIDFIKLIKKYGRDDSDFLYLSFNYNVEYALRNSRLKKDITIFVN